MYSIFGIGVLHSASHMYGAAPDSVGMTLPVDMQTTPSALHPHSGSLQHVPGGV